MQAKDHSPKFVAVLALLAVLSSVAALSSAGASEPEPSSFEANASVDG
jgi:hypothetical protein